MRLYTLQTRGVALLSIILFHTAVSSPVVRRDVIAAISADQDEDTASLALRPLGDEAVLDEGAFGGDAGAEGGKRDKRLIKLGLGLGAGLKTAGLVGAKAVGKAGLKAVTSVGVKLAKAALTIGIAKLLLTLIFGKINQVIDYKTRLLNGQSGGGSGLLSISSLSSSSSGSGSSATIPPSGSDSTDPAGGEELPDIDPDKVALQVPDVVISSGFNVINRAAPIVGNVIQNTAERVARLVETLKPILKSSVGFSVTTVKRQSPAEHRVATESPIKSGYLALTND